LIPTPYRFHNQPALKSQTSFPAAAQKETIFTELFSLFFKGRLDENESEAKSNPQETIEATVTGVDWSDVDMDVDVDVDVPVEWSDCIVFSAMYMEILDRPTDTETRWAQVGVKVGESSMLMSLAYFHFHFLVSACKRNHFCFSLFFIYFQPFLSRFSREPWSERPTDNEIKLFHISWLLHWQSKKFNIFHRPAKHGKEKLTLGKKVNFNLGWLGKMFGNYSSQRRGIDGFPIFRIKRFCSLKLCVYTRLHNNVPTLLLLTFTFFQWQLVATKYPHQVPQRFTFLVLIANKSFE